MRHRLPLFFAAVSLVGLVGALAAACSTSDASSPGATPPAPAPTGASGTSAAFRATLANPAPPDLAEGERIYYEETFGSEVENEWPPAAFMVSLWKSDPTTWGVQFSKFGWLVDPGDDLPVGLKRGTTDPTLVHETCAACHVTQLPDGRIWSGMPATNLDWAAFALAVNQAWIAAGHGSMISDAQIAKLQGVPQPGSSNADSVADPHVVPTDFPLYVDLGKRQNLSYVGGSRDSRSQIFLSIFTFGAGDTLPFPPASITDPLVAYLSWTVAPTPLTVDSAAAARGQTVFQNEKCDSCHHEDDLMEDRVAAWTSGDEVLPSGAGAEGTIATDANFFGLQAEGAGADGGGPGAGLDKILQFIGKNELKVGGSDGYAVTDLHGLFATAPYLHNGSVPTLEDLLTPPAERPVTFVRGGHTVDTTKDGMSNRGHAFGTELGAADRADLIAYLESL